MNKSEIEEKLIQLSNMRSALDVINFHFQELRDSILTPEIKEKLAEIDAEMNSATEAANEGISKLIDEIKQSVEEFGETVHSEHLMAVYNHGKTTWDTKGLSGFAIAHPEILKFQKNGKPFVSIQPK